MENPMEWLEERNADSNRLTKADMDMFATDMMGDPEGLEKSLAYAMMANFNIDLDRLDDAELGRMVREYVLESQHGSWDGITGYELLAWARMLADISRYIRSSQGL